MSDSLNKQAKALENQFFQQVDEKLLEQIRKNLASVPQREALAQVSNLKNPEVLDKLLELGINAETFAAMLFVPLAAVAWADGTLDENERQAVQEAATHHGVQPGKPGYVLLEQWLQQPPSAALIGTWKDYIAALKLEVEPSWLAALKAEMLQLTEQVATASGGILGLGNKVSTAEKQKIAELSRAFE